MEDAADRKTKRLSSGLLSIKKHKTIEDKRRELQSGVGQGE